MKKITINGKEIVTNYGETGADAIVSGDDLPNYRLCIKTNCRESDAEFIARLAESYSRIRLARCTTRVRGIYDTIAYCR